MNYVKYIIKYALIIVFIYCLLYFFFIKEDNKNIKIGICLTAILLANFVIDIYLYYNDNNCYENFSVPLSGNNNVADKSAVKNNVSYNINITNEDLGNLIDYIISAINNANVANKLNSALVKLNDLNENFAVFIAKIIEIIKIDYAEQHNIIDSFNNGKSRILYNYIDQIPSFQIPQKIIDSSFDNINDLNLNDHLFGFLYNKYNNPNPKYDPNPNSNQYLNSNQNSNLNSNSTNNIVNDKNISDIVISVISHLKDQGYVKINEDEEYSLKNSDVKYSQMDPRKTENLGDPTNKFGSNWNNEYTLLNTSKWAPVMTNYNCKYNDKCPPCSQLTSGYPLNLKEFDSASKLIHDDNINIKYIKDKLNIR